MKPYPCPKHPDGLIRHTYDLTQCVLNGYPSGEGVRSNNKLVCHDCGMELESLEEFVERSKEEERSRREIERDRINAANGWGNESRSALSGSKESPEPLNAVLSVDAKVREVKLRETLRTLHEAGEAHMQSHPSEGADFHKANADFYKALDTARAALQGGGL